MERRFKLRRWLLSMWLGLAALATGTAAEPPAKTTGEVPVGAGPFTGVVYRPDGGMLAVAQRGRVWLLDADGEVLAEIDSLPPKVTALSFSRDGGRLAVAAGRPGQLGELRLYAIPANVGPDDPPTLQFTQQAHTDLIHDVAFSPDGSLVATCSYDRLVKLWKTSDGSEAGTLQEHSDAVYGLAFRPDGKLLASVAADRTVKVWDVARRQRLYTLNEATDWLYCVAFSPDGRQLAAAGVDRTLRLWAVTESSGHLNQSTFAHEKPIVQVHFSSDGRSITTFSEDGQLKRWNTSPLKEQRVLRLPDAAVRFAWRSDQRQLAVAGDRLTLHDESSGRLTAEPLPTLFPLVRLAGTTALRLPAAVLATVPRPGAEVVIPLSLRAREELGVWATPVSGSPLRPRLELRDATGQVVAGGRDGVLAYRSGSAGRFFLALRDLDYRGGPAFRCRVRLGPVPVVTRVFPLGLQRGTTVTFQLDGVNLGELANITLTAPADASPGQLLPLQSQSSKLPVLPLTQVVVGEFPERTGPTQAEEILPLPVTVNGVCDPVGLWRFRGTAGQPMILEIHAQRLGSPLDSVIEVLDEKHQPVPIAQLRSVGQTFVTLRNHDSRTGGIRIENWDGFAINDFLYGNGELMRIFELPRNNDDDIRLYTENGQRLAFLGTTPSHHGLGTPLYRVEVHPPGRSFPPNGYPLFTLVARNDDGGSEFGKDSRLTFIPPTDGTYFLRVSDARGRSGPNLVYRLTLRLPRPDFSVRAVPSGLQVPRGGTVPVSVTVQRHDGHAEPLAVGFTALPQGLQAPPAEIPSDENSTVLGLSVDPHASLPDQLAPLEIVVRSRSQEKRVSLGSVKVVDPGEIIPATAQTDLHLVPGGTVTLTAHIERRRDFKGRVPLEVRGLPHGVRVLDIGLNGILITESETQRSMRIYCEPWVAPRTLHPVVVARSEKSGREYAARPITLTIGLSATTSTTIADQVPSIRR